MNAENPTTELTGLTGNATAGQKPDETTTIDHSLEEIGALADADLDDEEAEAETLTPEPVDPDPRAPHERGASERGFKQLEEPVNEGDPQRHIDRMHSIIDGLDAHTSGTDRVHVGELRVLLNELGATRSE